MKSLNNLRITFVCFGFVVGLVASTHRSANANVIFGTTTNLGTGINASYNDGTPCISRDGLSLYFASTRPGGVGTHDLWVATRASTINVWSEPVHLGDAVNDRAQDYGPTISDDGLTLYFRSTRSGGLGQGDIWVSTRPSKDAPWPAAVNAGPGINTSSDECMPCISPDGLELYFGSRRGGGYGQDDLYVVTRSTTGSDWSNPENLGPTVNSGAVDACPCISPDGLTLFFNSTRSGGFGNYDLYVTTRPSAGAAWSTAINLGETINTVDDEMTPWFWADGSMIYFSSWAESRHEALGGADLWQAAIEPIVDLNGDGIVDSADMCIIIDNWGTDDPLCDIGPMSWGDGIVDVQDLIVLAEHLFEEILPYGCVAYWKLDQSEGNIAHDSAGDNDGICHGEPIWQPAGGKVGGALQLDGIDDYVETGFVLNPVDGGFSAFAWIRGGAPGQVIISQADTLTGRTINPGSIWLGLDPSDGKLMTTLTDPPITLLSESIISDGQWRHVGVVLIETGSLWFRLLYLDGVMVALDTQAVELLSSNGGLYIGANNNIEAGTFFSGLIDDVRIYDIALSTEEIAAMAK